MRPFLPRPRALYRAGIAAAAAVAMIASASAQTVYHDQTLGFHLGRYIALKSSGHRLVSLDVAGDIGDQHWSAVWELGSGPDWTAAAGMTASEFAGWRIARILEGYRDAWITSAGGDTDVVFGGWMVRDGRQAFASHDVDAATFDAHLRNYGEQGYLLTSVSAHGTAQAPRYALVMVQDPGNIRWGYRRNETAAQLQTSFDAFVQACRARPAILTSDASHRYTAVYYDDAVGDWIARSGLTKSGYETTAAQFANTGYRPVQIMAAGVGSAARYSALFRRGSAPASVATAIGIAVPAFAAVDTLMIGDPQRNTPGFMQNRRAQAAGVAITKNGRLVFARAYTYGPSGTEITQPTSGFRIASVSKPIAAIAAYHAAQRSAQLTIDSRLVDVVDLGTPADSRYGAITLRHLIDHRAGIDFGWGTAVSDKLAQARNDAMNRSLANQPGATEAYSNVGYQYLSLAIEAASGRPYWDYVRDELLAPLGIQRPHLITSAPQAGDVFCRHGGFVGAQRVAIEPNFMRSGSPLDNSAYAINAQSMDASGGLVMSPVDFVRLMSGVFDPTIVSTILDAPTRAALQASIEMPGRTGGFDGSADRWVDGRVVRSYTKGGLWRSAHTFGVWRTDGVAIAAFCSGPSAPDIGAIQNIVDQVANADAWPTHDLFPSFGLPSFARRSPGSTTLFGSACGGVLHTGTGLPEIGMVRNFNVALAPSSSPAWLFLGTSKTLWQGLSLPLELGYLGAAGCRVLVSLDVVESTTTGPTGAASFAVPIPNQPSMIGTSLHTQFAVASPRSNRLGLLLSNGVTTVLGN